MGLIRERRWQKINKIAYPVALAKAVPLMIHPKNGESCDEACITC
jgi:hypothetical protein